MAYRKFSDDSSRRGYGDRRPAGDRRENGSRSNANGYQRQRTDRGGKPYAYGDDKPRREKVTKPAPAPVQQEAKDPDELPFLIFGRNAHSGTVPRNANVADYRVATGLETLLGHLWVLGREERIDQLMAIAVQVNEEAGKED